MAALKRAQKAAHLGDLAGLKKALEQQAEVARAAQLDQTRVAWSLTEDQERRLLEDGTFVRELRTQGERVLISITEQDGLLLCYPVVVRVDAAKRSVSIDKKPDRNIRPSVLVGHLAALQTKPPSAKPDRFIEALYKAWEYARHREAAGRLPADDVRVTDLWAVLTVVPGSDREYTKQEFGRDLAHARVI